MNTARLFHQTRVEFRRRAAGYSPHVTGVATTRRRSSGTSPKVISRVRQETSIALRKQTAPSAVAFRQNNLIEQLDARVFGAGGLALVDELVELLGLAQHVHVFGVAVRAGLEEGVHVEVVDEAGFLGLAGRRVQVAPVGVEERGEAADESGTNLVGVEGDRADGVDCVDAAGVDGCGAACEEG